MTLVASYCIENWPIVVGDIMVSIPAHGRTTGPFNIPTWANVNARTQRSEGRLVSGLVQKVNLVTPQLAIAWSGTTAIARGITCEIIERGASPTILDVQEVLNLRTGEAGNDLYLTGLYLQGEQNGEFQISQFAWDAQAGWGPNRRSIAGYGDCYAGGTGATALIDLITDTAANLPTNTPPIESAIMRSLGHLGRLAGDQMRRGIGLDEAYGGAFELATLRNGQIQKIEDVTYHFWQARTLPDSSLTITFHSSIRIAYFEDYLVLRKLEYVVDASAANPDELYIIRPVYRTVDDKERERLIASVAHPSMNTQLNVFYVHFPERTGSQNIYVSVHKSPTQGASEMIAYEEADNGLLMKISPELQQRVRQALTGEITT